MRFETSLAFAVGEGYPRQFTATFSDRSLGRCGPGSTSFELPSLVDDTDVLDIQLDGPRTISFTVGELGQAVFSGVGSVTVVEEGCGLPVGTFPLDFELSVSVRAAVGSRIRTPCSGERLLVAPGAPPSELNWGEWFWVQLADEDGTFVAINADRDAQVGVTLEGTFDAERSSPTSLDEWVPPSTPGRVDIVPQFGSPATVEVVSVDAVTEIDLGFQIGGVRTAPIVLEDGASYGPEWGSTANRVAPVVQEVWIGDQMLCSAPSPAWFELTTTTPDTCEPAEPTASFDGDPVGLAMRMRDDGTCALRLETPLGVVPLSATFEGVEGLYEW